MSNKQVRWYIEQALRKFEHPDIVINDEYPIDWWIDVIVEDPNEFGLVVFHALELAIKDIG